MSTEPATSSPTPAPERAFTLRACLIGLLGGCLIAIVAGYNDYVLRQPLLIGNHLPAGPIAIAVIIGLIWNPLMGRIWRPLALSARELLVSLAMMLVCCWLPTSGFFRYFHAMTARPWIDAPSRPAWALNDTAGWLPEAAFPLGGRLERTAMERVLAAQPAATAEEAPAFRILVASEGLAFAPDTVGAATAAGLRLIPPQDDAAIAMLARVGRDLAKTGGDPVWDRVHARLKPLVEQELAPLRARAGTTYDKFVSGIPVGDETIPLVGSRVDPATGRTIDGPPWQDWLPVAAAWAPIVVCMAIAILALALVVHIQWARNEQLAYPLATVTWSLVERRGTSLVPAIFTHKLFWLGATPVLLLHACNYLNAWFPGHVPRIDLGWQFAPEVRDAVPALRSVSDYNAFGGRVFFLVIGAAYFVAAEISLSMGLSGLLLCLVGMETFALTGKQPEGESLRGGAYLAYAALILYTGRTYYWTVLKRACFLGRAEGSDREPVWAARIFILAFLGFTASLCLVMGLDWFVALVYGLIVMVLFLVFSRIICETGIPFMQAGWQPGILMTGLFGAPAIGPAALVFITYLSGLLTQDPRESLTPYAATALKNADQAGIGRSRTILATGAAMLVVLAVGFAAWTYTVYNSGTSVDSWARQVPGNHLDVADRSLTQLRETGQLAVSQSTDGLAKLGLVSTAGNEDSLFWITAGAAGVVLFATLRFTWSWWPLHPVLFLVWGTYPGYMMASSFLIGWMIKVLIVKFGGGKVYQDLKPFFLGLICAEILAIAAIIIIGFGYHLTTGAIPKTIHILPG